MQVSTRRELYQTPLTRPTLSATMDGMDVDQPTGGPRSTSPLAFGSSSSIAHPSSDPATAQPQPQQLAQLRSSGTNPREYPFTRLSERDTRLTRFRLVLGSSSPLAFPSSSAGSARGPAASGQRLFASGGPSSDARNGAGPTSNGQRYRGDSPLFFPG